MKKYFFGVAFLALMGTFCGCSPHLAKGPVEQSEGLAPDSLKAKFSVKTQDPVDGSHTLSGVLFAVPYKRYRMEFSGPMGIGVASLLWKEGDWSLVLPAQKAYVTGKGYLVGGVAGIPLFDIHRVAALFWGDALPRGGTVDSVRTDLGEKKIFGTGALGIPFVATCDGDGRIVKISQNAERLEFSDYALFEKLVVPLNAVFFQRENAVLEIRLKSVKTDAEWGTGTWRLPISEEYELLKY